MRHHGYTTLVCNKLSDIGIVEVVAMETCQSHLWRKAGALAITLTLCAMASCVGCGHGGGSRSSAEGRSPSGTAETPAPEDSRTAQTDAVDDEWSQDEPAREAYDRFTAEALSDYLYKVGDRPYAVLGSGSVQGDGRIDLASSEAPDNAVYSIAYLCRQEHPSEYSLSLSSTSGEDRTLIRGEACAPDGVNIISLPADRLSFSVHHVTVAAESDTAIIANVFLNAE